MGPCMCGALDCSFCGPLQGSRKCNIHRRYACDECEDYAEEHGKLPDIDDDWEYDDDDEAEVDH